MNAHKEPPAVKVSGWQLYEIEKRKLQALCLSAGEYEKRLQALAKRLGL